MIFLFDADSCISDVNFYDTMNPFVAGEDCLDVYKPTSGRELESIALEVEQNLLQSLLVSAYLEIILFMEALEL